MSDETTDKAALSHSFDEKLFRLLVDNVSDYAIYMIDANGYIMSWNEGAERIKGYNEDEIIGKHITVFYTPSDNKKNVARHNLNEALKHGRYETEGWRVKKDGSVFWANVTFTTIYDDNDRLVGFAKITRDSTERKRIEDEKEKTNINLEKRVEEKTAEAIATELRFRKLIENNYDGITLFDSKLKMVYRSISAQRILGWNNNERALYELTDLIHPDDRERLTKTFTEILNSPDGAITISIYRTKHKEGYYIWIESVFTNLLNDENIRAIVCNFRDITEKKHAEEEVRKKNEQIEDILESITDGFIALDKDFCYTYANHKIGEMLHTDPDSLLGKYIWSEFPDAVNSETYKAFYHAVKKQEYICNEDYYAPLDLWQENHIYPSANGGLSVFIRDVSGRKKAERQILLLNENLEKKVIERTGQLEAANKELESFSYSVSHDLRAPLRAVNGYAMMLKEDYEGKLGEDGNRIINTIITNARLMGQLIDDLLAFSRMGRKEIVVLKVDMNSLVKVCVRELLEHENKKYEVKLHKLPSCNADISLLRQVLLNLISNAVKYSSKREQPAIEIGSIPDDQKRIYYVKDNGVGFDMKYSHKLFGVFQRLHRTEEFEGTGVGLALAKRIINKHGGSIWAEAVLGEGAQFYFSLPKK